MPRNRELRGTNAHPRDTGSFVPYLEDFIKLLNPSDVPLESALSIYVRLYSKRICGLILKDSTFDLTPYLSKVAKKNIKSNETVYDLTSQLKKKIIKDKGANEQNSTFDLTPYLSKVTKKNVKSNDETSQNTLTTALNKDVQEQDSTFDLTPYLSKVTKKNIKSNQTVYDLTSQLNKKIIKDKGANEQNSTFDLTPYLSKVTKKNVKSNHETSQNTLTTALNKDVQEQDSTFDLTPYLSKVTKKNVKSNQTVYDLTSQLNKKIIKDKGANEQNETSQNTLTTALNKDVQEQDSTFDLTPYLSKVTKKNVKSNQTVYDLTSQLNKKIIKDKGANEQNSTFDLTPYLSKVTKKNVKSNHETSQNTLTTALNKDVQEQDEIDGARLNFQNDAIHENEVQDEDCTDMETENEESTDLVQNYHAEIPTDTFAYKLYPDKIKADLMNQCRCGTQCKDLLLMDKNIVYKVQLFRSECFSLKQGHKRMTMILRKMIDSFCQETGKKNHLFHGQNICKEKWIDLLGISQTTYYRVFSLMKYGYISVAKPAKNKNRNFRGLAAIGLIQNFLDSYGDPSPERNVILLPDCINIKYMFDEYKSLPGNHLQKAAFYRVFQENFAKIVSFSKTKNINPCDICMKVKLELHKITEVSEKEKLKKDLKIHLDRQRLERQDYYRKKGEAELKPTEAMSLIVDGMDQSKTNIPHFKGWTRPKAGSAALKTHITGCLAHGKQLFLFIDLLQWSHDPNLTISCLIQAISNNTSSLPPKLYIQCDNCGRENKNKYVIGFLGYLCLAGYVKEAHLSFLIKGHTHEDIDQRFSKISQRLRRVNALTLPELQNEVEESFSKKPHQEVLGCVWDVKEWLDPVLRDISAHSYQHQFWMFCDRPKHVVFKYRRFSSDAWLPEGDENQLELFDLDLSGDHLLPKGYPKYVIPKYEEGRFHDVRQAIQKMKSFLTYDQYKWWTDFLQDPERTIKRNSRWPILPLKKVHLLTNIPMEIPENSDPSCIGNMLLTEGTLREVVTRKRKRKGAD